MRVLQIAQKPQRRGAEIFAHQLSEELHRCGHTVRNLYLYPYCGDRPLPLNSGDRVLNGTEKHLLERAPGVHPLLLRKLLRALDEFGPDIVQVNGARTVKYGSFARRLRRSAGWRLIYRNIDNPTFWVTDMRRRWFYKQLVIPRVDGVVGVSQVTLDNLRELYDLKAPSVYIPNGINTRPLDAAPTQTEARRQLDTALDTLVVLFMGNLTAQKRPDRFVRIVHDLAGRHPNLEAWILGDGPQRMDVEEQVVQLGLIRQVRFWGYAEHIAPYLAGADLLLITSDSDGIPAVVLEAGYLGKPAVATRVGGLPECVLHSRTGLLADAEDEEGFAQLVSELLEDPVRREEMGSQVRNWIRSNFTIEEVARRYLDFYRSVGDSSLLGSEG